MGSWDPKFSGNTKKKLIHSNLVIERKVRWTKGGEITFEIGTELLNPC